MSRRFAAVGGMRRAVRGGSHVTADPIASALGSILIEDMDAARGYTLASDAVQSLMGQKLGVLVTAPGASQRPDYTASDAAFNGKPSINFDDTGSLGLTGTHGSPILAAGIRPYIISVGRVRTLKTAAAGLWSMYAVSNGATNTCGIALEVDSDGAGNDYLYGYYRDGGVERFATGTDNQDTDAHVYALENDATDGLVLLVDNVEAATAASARVTQATASRLDLGNRNGFGYGKTDLARLLICSEKPDADVLTQVLGLLDEEYIP